MDTPMAKDDMMVVGGFPAGGPGDPRVPANGNGALRRRIRLEATDGLVRGGVEDDFHHFEVTIQHDGTSVTAITGKGRRTPWMTCPAAAAQLTALIGTEIGTDVVRRRNLPDAYQQCTHMFELAILAIAQAARGGRRQYDLYVPDRIGRTQFPILTADGHIQPAVGGPDGTTYAALERDGAPLARWDVDGELVVEPERFRGLKLRDIGRWVAEAPDDETVEIVKILRRGLHVAGGRAQPYDLIPGAFAQPYVSGACYAFQPERQAEGLRPKVSRKDFTNRREDLLADFW